jgi:hypothetical protein
MRARLAAASLVVLGGIIARSDDISLARLPAGVALHPLKSLSVPQHVHRERLLLRQVRSVDQLRVLDPIGADEDGIHDPFSP